MRHEPTATPDVAPTSSESQLPRTRAEAKALGVRHYFTGVPCRRGHLSKRHTSGGGCLKCACENVSVYNARNPEKRRQLDASRSKEQIKFYNDRRSKEKIKFYNSRRDKEKARIAIRLKREMDPSLREKATIQQRNWRAKNPEKVRSHLATRRAVRINAKGSYSANDIQEIFAAQKGKCAYFRKCRTSIRDDYHVDHIVALSRGGSNFRSNLQLLCPRCNCRKNAKDAAAFARELGFLV